MSRAASLRPIESSERGLFAAPQTILQSRASATSASMTPEGPQGAKTSQASVAI
jgi:hypothetical protein